MVLKLKGAKTNNTNDTHIYSHGNLHSVRYTRATNPAHKITPLGTL